MFKSGQGSTIMLVKYEQPLTKDPEMAHFGELHLPHMGLHVCSHLQQTIPACSSVPFTTRSWHSSLCTYLLIQNQASWPINNAI